MVEFYTARNTQCLQVLLSFIKLFDYLSLLIDTDLLFPSVDLAAIITSSFFPIPINVDEVYASLEVAILFKKLPLS